MVDDRRTDLTARYCATAVMKIHTLAGYLRA